MQTNDLVSRNIRRFRAERELSLGDLARRSGVSKQTLSKIEGGAGNPTVETLERIGSALGVSIRRLVTEWGTRTLVVRGDGADWSRTASGEARHLDRVYGSGYVSTRLVVVDAVDRRRIVLAHPPGTLHQLYVVSGRLEAGPEGEVAELGPGDFMRFPGDVDHHYRGLGGRAVAHLTTTAPQVPQFAPGGADGGGPE